MPRPPFAAMSGGEAREVQAQRRQSLARVSLAPPEGIATNVLADRLAKLVSNRLVERVASPVGRDAYRLTKKGESLLPLLQQIADWGLANVKGTEVRLLARGRSGG